MQRILPPLPAMLAACTPSPQGAAAMRSPDPVSASAAGRGVAGPLLPGQADRAPMPEAVSVAENPAPSPDRDPTQRPDGPDEARGRAILSAAFVRTGADGHLTVDLADGHSLVLRDVTMNARDYCGTMVQGGVSGKRYCGGYAGVVAARPGGGADRLSPESGAANPLPDSGSR